ncbi:MAG: hypothetical protein EA383_13035 [Spirochaetaceae bacterium]|nr:MAG: hypothetical protein EA383_13035 [Spirochaetaceae bacterium]
MFGNDGDLSANHVEPARDLKAYVSRPDNRDTRGQLRQIEGRVRRNDRDSRPGDRDGQIALHGTRTHENVLASDRLPVHLNKVGGGDVCGTVDKPYAGLFELISHAAAHAFQNKVLVLYSYLLPVLYRIGIDSEKRSLVSVPVQNAAGDHAFRRHAPVVQAGSADRVLFYEHDAAAASGDPFGSPDTCRAASDHHQIKLLFSHRKSSL